MRFSLNQTKVNFSDRNLTNEQLIKELSNNYREILKKEEVLEGSRNCRIFPSLREKRAFNKVEQLYCRFVSNLNELAQRYQERRDLVPDTRSYAPLYLNSSEEKEKPLYTQGFICHYIAREHIFYKKGISTELFGEHPKLRDQTFLFTSQLKDFCASLPNNEKDAKLDEPEVIRKLQQLDAAWTATEAHYTAHIRESLVWEGQESLMSRGIQKILDSNILSIDDIAACDPSLPQYSAAAMVLLPIVEEADYQAKDWGMRLGIHPSCLQDLQKKFQEIKKNRKYSTSDFSKMLLEEVSKSQEGRNPDLKEFVSSLMNAANRLAFSPHERSQFNENLHSITRRLAS